MLKGGSTRCGYVLRRANRPNIGKLLFRMRCQSRGNSGMTSELSSLVRNLTLPEGLPRRCDPGRGI